MPPHTNTIKKIKPPTTRQHGVKGVYYGGKWVPLTSSTADNKKEHDMEDFMAQDYNQNFQDKGCRLYNTPCPRSSSRFMASSNGVYDVVVVGAGCVGAAVARELSRYRVKTLWLEVRCDVLLYMCNVCLVLVCVCLSMCFLIVDVICVWNICISCVCVFDHDHLCLCI